MQTTGGKQGVNHGGPLGCFVASGITRTTTYIGGSVYESLNKIVGGNPDAGNYTDKLQFLAHEEGRIRLVEATQGSCSPQPDRFVFDYFIKDHLGNVRMVLTEQSDDICYIPATVEENSWQTESAIYDITAGRRVEKSTTGAASISSFGDWIYRTHGGVAVEKSGLGVTLKVMAGDQVRITAESFYTMPAGGAGQPTGTLALGDLLAAFVQSGAVATTHGGISTGDVAGAGANSSLIPGFLSGADEGADNARAFLNWILFDEQFNYVAGGADPVQPGGGYKLHSEFINNPVVAQKSGYLYIFVSNESDFAVFFDNLGITHIPGAILEETHYYPFGLTMAGISSKAAGGLVNRKKFNAGSELQYQEFSDGSGLELYATPLRSLDPQLGRWWQIDPKPDYSQSLYAAMGNNPILFNDPLGDTLRHSFRTGFLGIFGKKVTVDYRDGKYYSAGTNTAYTGKLGGFQKTLLSNLSTLSSNEVSADVMKNLENNSTIVNIKKGNDEFNPVADKNGQYTLTLSGSKAVSSDYNQNGVGTSIPNIIAAAHELYHAYDRINNGISDFLRVNAWFTSSISGGPVARAEIGATHFENRLRANMGLPLREFYGVDRKAGITEGRILYPGTSLSMYYHYLKTVEIEGREYDLRPTFNYSTDRGPGGRN